MDRVLAYSGARSAGTLLVILGIAMMPAFAQNDKRELPQRIHAEPPGGAPPGQRMGIRISLECGFQMAPEWT